MCYDFHASSTQRRTLLSPQTGIQETRRHFGGPRVWGSHGCYRKRCRWEEKMSGVKKASKATAVVKAMKKRALGASEVKVKVQVAEAPKAMKKKGIRAAGKVRERGLCMEPRYVASRGYAKVRVAYIREKLLAHGLTKIKEATKKQRLRWGVKGKELGREEHARLMAMAAQNLD